MTTANHISQDDLLLFALQFLPEDEQAAVHDHLLGCEDCRRQAAFLQGDLSSYALTADMQTPPEGARERFLRGIAREKRMKTAGPQLVAVTPAEVEEKTNVVSIESAPARRRMGFAGWAGWAVAAAAIASAGMQYRQTQGFQSELAESRAELKQLSQDAAKLSEDAAKAGTVLETLTDPSAKQVALHVGKSTTAPEAHASYLAKKGSLVFVANHLGPLQADKTYQLWLIPAGKGAVPIPAGTFKPDAQGRASLVLSSLPKNVNVALVGVTVEPDGGSQSPTLPIVLVGE